MTEVLNLLGNDLLLPIFTVIFTVVYFSIAILFLSRIKQRKNERDSQLLKSISNGLNNNQVEDVHDLVNVYRGITNTTDDDVSYKAAVGRALRRILVSLANNSDASEPNRNLKYKIKKLLAQIEAETPFADVPVAERNLILDACRFIDFNELVSAKQKIKDLANLIEVRQDGFEKLQASNKWSVPLAIVGLVLTVVFGLMSLR